MLKVLILLFSLNKHVFTISPAFSISTVTAKLSEAVAKVSITFSDAL